MISSAVVKRVHGGASCEKRWNFPAPSVAYAAAPSPAGRVVRDGRRTARAAQRSSSRIPTPTSPTGSTQFKFKDADRLLLRRLSFRRLVAGTALPATGELGAMDEDDDVGVVADVAKRTSPDVEQLLPLLM